MKKVFKVLACTCAIVPLSFLFAGCYDTYGYGRKDGNEAPENKFQQPIIQNFEYTDSLDCGC